MIGFKTFINESNQPVKSMMRSDIRLGSSRPSSRLWYHPKSERVVTIPVGQNHSSVVADSPDLFGLEDHEVPSGNVKDYDEAVLFSAMKKGWVRMMIDIRNPDTNSNVEGSRNFGLRKATKWFYDTYPSFQKFIVVLRKDGSGDQDHKILEPSTIERYIKTSEWSVASSALARFR